MKRYIQGILIACLMMQGQQLLAANFDGELDSTFGPNNDGKVTFSVQNPLFDSDANAVVIRHDGKIVVGGRCKQSASSDTGFALAILEPDGSEVCTCCFPPMAPGSCDSINGLAVQPDNKVVAVGFGASAASFVVARFNRVAEISGACSRAG